MYAIYKTRVSDQDWMYKNKLNLDKMEFLLIGNKCPRKYCVPSFPKEIFGNKIPIPAQNLGVIFDEDFSFVPPYQLQS